MKKTLLTLSVFAIVFSAPAQITITQADIAPLYSQVRIANDTLIDTSMVHIGNPGASQTWNLAALHNNRVDTNTFTLPQFTAYGPTHTSSNRAIVQGSGANNTANVYATLNSTGLFLDATEADPLGLGNNINLVNTPSETDITFPSTFNTSFSNNFISTSTFFYGMDPGIGVVLDSVMLKINVIKNSNIDGWGNVTTPVGTYPCVRQNVLRATTDSVWGYNMPIFGGWAFLIAQQDSNRVYDYWTNGAGYPVAELTDKQDLGTLTTGFYLLSVAQVGMAELHSNASLISVYPNPASENLSFVTKGNAVSTIEVYDVTGNVIATQQVVNDNTIMNVNGFANGIYFYNAIDAKGNVIDRGKFVVAH